MWLENKMLLVVTDTWECLRKMSVEIKMAQVVNEHSYCLTKAYLDIKMARFDEVLEDGRRIAELEDWLKKLADLCP